MSETSEALERELENRHKRTTYLSFGSARFTMTFVFAPIDLFLLFFYVQVLGLNIVFYLAAQAIFAVWDAVNNPIFAWLLDRNFRWTKRFGRRFPWIVIGSSGWALGLFLLFTSPGLPDATVNPLPTFLWLVFALFLFDLFGAIAVINIELLRPDKFRTEEERRLLQGYNTPLSMIAQAMGMLIPPLFLLGPGDDPLTYTFMGGMIAIITIISVLLYLPGCREDQQIKDLYLGDDSPRLNILEGAWEVIKMKSFWFSFLGTVVYMTVNGMVTGSLIYVLTFEFDSPGLMIPALAVWLLAALISVPFWFKISQKFRDTKKIYLSGMVVYGVAALIFFFYMDIVTLLIFAFLMGFSVSPMWIFGPNVYANVMDEHMVRTGKNQKGMVMGTESVFNRLAAFLDTIIITIVFIITGFADYSGFASLADLQAVATAAEIEGFVLGFHLIVGLIPMMLLFVGALLFWKFYPLNKQRVLEIKDKIVELNL